MKHQTVKGRLEKIFDLEEGTTDNGWNWCKQDILVGFEDTEQKVCFTVRNSDTKFLVNIDEGDFVEIEYSVSSNEYDSRWFTSVVAHAISRVRTPEIADFEYKESENNFNRDQDSEESYELESSN